MNGKYRLHIRIICYISFLCFTATLSSCGKKETKETTSQLETLKIEPTLASNSLFFSGIINPLNEENVTSPIEGVVNKQYFRYGQEIKKGQALFALSPDRLEKEYIEAISNYVKAQDDYTTKKRKFAGSEELRKLQFIAENEYFSDKTSVEESYFSLQQTIRHLKEVMTKMGIQKSITDINIKDPEFVKNVLHNRFKDYVIKAHANGVALTPQKSTEESGSDNKISVGSEVKQGQVILSIGNMSGLSVTVDVNEIEVNQLKPQQKAIVTGTAFPGITLEGHIQYVDAQAKGGGASSLPAFPVTIYIPNINEDARNIIRVGMSARIEIAIEEPNVIVVPLKAVFQENGKDKIKIMNKKNEIHVINVITGRTTQDSIIIKKGLKPGDTIVYNH